MHFDSFQQRDFRPYPSSQPSLLTFCEEHLGPRLPQRMKASSVEPSDGIICSDVETTMVAQKVSDESTRPRTIARDSLGNPLRYQIGPADSAREVNVRYFDPAANPPIVQRAEIKGADNSSVVYERQSDPFNKGAQAVYTESRNGQQSDLLYGNVEVEADGRINLFHDFERKRKAISFNPTTGGEEFH